MAGIRSVVAGGAIPFALALPASTTTGPASLPPGQRVFCLSTAQRPQLIDAAVALQLAQPSGTPGVLAVPDGGRTLELPVRRWALLRADDFRTACTALIASQAPAAAPAPAAPAEPDRSGLRTTLVGLIPVLFGALLGVATSAYSSWRKDRLDNRRLLAADLSTAVRAFSAATGGFFASEPGTDRGAARSAIQQARSDLLHALRQITVNYPDQPAPRDLRQRVVGPALTDWTGVGWAPADVEERRRVGRQVAAEVGAVEQEAELIAVALRGRSSAWAAIGRAAAAATPAPSTPPPSTPATEQQH